MNKVNFKTRSTLPELMDQEGVSTLEIHQALTELENINQFLGGYNVILSALNQIKWENNTLKIVDIGCGGGDVLREISKWAKKNKKSVELIGVDRNPEMTAFAEHKSKEYKNISYRTIDVWSDQLSDLKADITINSLFCHHFDDKELVRLVKRMQETSSKAVIINDLHRHWFAYHSIKLITKFFSKTYLVKYDGPLSVARALVRNEWENVFKEANILNYQMKWMWAWRWQIIINK